MRASNDLLEELFLTGDRKTIKQIFNDDPAYKLYDYNGPCLVKGCNVRRNASVLCTEHSDIYHKHYKLHYEKADTLGDWFVFLYFIIDANRSME